MEAREFQDPLPPEALISNAVERFDSNNEKLLPAIRDLAENPSRRTGRLFNECSTAALDSFRDAVRVIAGCEELPIHDRAGHIAAICLNSERIRLDFLREASPGSEFENMAGSHDDFTGMFEDLMEEGHDTDEIADSATGIYVRSFGADLTEFIESAEPSTKAKARLFLRQLGDEAIDFGKLTAAVAIGTLISHRIMKSLEK